MSNDGDITGGGKVMLLTGPFGDPERLISLDRPMAIAEVIARHELAFRLPTIAVMDGEPVMRGEWAIRVVRPEDTLAFVAVPRGGGNGSGKQVVGIIAAIAPSIAAPFGGGALATAILGAGAAGSAGFIALSGVASLAFIGGTSLEPNALVPEKAKWALLSSFANRTASLSSQTAAPICTTARWLE